MQHALNQRVAAWLAALLAALLVNAPGPARAASFDCNTARMPVEKRICTDATLSSLDDALAVAYRAMRRAGLADSQLDMQRHWLSERSRCTDTDCLVTAYKARITELEAATDASLAKWREYPGDGFSETLPVYTVQCDPKRYRLIVKEKHIALGGDTKDLDAPQAGGHEYLIHPIEASADDERDHPLPDASASYECKLGTALYRVNVDPLTVVTNSLCGAPDPGVTVEVLRNGIVAFPRQRTTGCGSDDLSLDRLRFDERRKAISLLVTINAEQFPVRLEKQYEFGAAPVESMEPQVMASVPTGDVDVDLFLGVAKVDPERVKDALGRGASPNARDLDGFTPLAYLKKQIYAAQPIATDEESLARDQLAIVQLLLQQGADVDVKNVHGVRLLEFLENMVSKSVLAALRARSSLP